LHQWNVLLASLVLPAEVVDHLLDGVEAVEDEVIPRNRHRGFSPPCTPTSTTTTAHAKRRIDEPFRKLGFLLKKSSMLAAFLVQRACDTTRPRQHEQV
jgi:hypothetical protein